MINQRENYRPEEEDNSYGEILPGVGTVSESLVQIIWRSRWIVLLATVVVLAAAFVYLVKAAPIYTSTSRIYVEQRGPKVLIEDQGIMTQSKNYLYTQAELLKSTPILASALEKPGIKQMKIFDNVDNPVVFLKKNALQVSVGKKDDIISISSDSPEPVEAAQLINAVVDSYITYHATHKRSTALEVLKILQKQSVERNKELMDKLTAMLNFKKANEGLALESRTGNIILQRLERLSETLTQAQLATIDAKSTYETTRAMVDDPANLKEFVEANISGYEYRSVADEKARLGTELDRLELQLANVKGQHKLTTDHPVVRELDNKIARIKKQIADFYEEFARPQLSMAHQQYLVAQEKEQQIREYLNEQREQALALNEQLVQYTLLQSDYEQTKRLCDLLEDRIKEINVTEDTGALNISILEVARPADKPSKPQKARIMAIAMVLGLMLGGGLALLRDWMDQRLRSAEEISALLGVPMLGVVPSMSRKLTIAARGQKVHLESTSSVAEAYRTIRTAIFFSVPKGKAKAVLVTSPGPGDGKTTLVSNLSIAMAQAGQRTLVLDADFRKPMQHKIFEIAKEPGLSSVIAGTQTLEKTIQHTSIPGLDILPCGPDVPNPSEMLNSNVFGDIMAELSLTYDRIVVDSPPVMPVTDACILAATCDVTLLVLRAEKSTRKTAQQARDGLLSVGAHLLGAVVNDVRRKKGRYGYYYGYYGYRYGYGRKEKEKEAPKEAAIVAANPGHSARNE